MEGAKNVGYDKCIAALEFHHRDPSQKEFSISKSKSLSWTLHKNRLIKELDKCDLLCCRCHREIHWNLSNKEESYQVYLEFREKELKKWNIKREISCLGCGKLFFSRKNRVFCSRQCFGKHAKEEKRFHKVEHPSKEELKDMVWQISLTAISNKLGVSISSVRRWCVKMDIEIPPRGYWIKNNKRPHSVMDST